MSVMAKTVLACMNIKDSNRDLQRANAELTKAEHAALRSLITTAKDRNRVSAELVAATEDREKGRSREIELALNLKAMTDQSNQLRVWRVCLIAALVCSQITIAILRWLT